MDTNGQQSNGQQPTDDSKSDPPAQSQGGSGGGAIHPESISPEGIRDTRLIERALREQWPIDDRFREAIVDRQVRIAISLESGDREATSAARCLVTMQSQNNESAFKALDKVVPDQHLLMIEQEEVRNGIIELQSDPEYLEFLRAKAVARDSDPRLLCGVREPGNAPAVENGEAHGGIGQGTNGHRNGSE